MLSSRRELYNRFHLSIVPNLYCWYFHDQFWQWIILQSALPTLHPCQAITSLSPNEWALVQNYTIPETHFSNWHILKHWNQADFGFGPVNHHPRQKRPSIFVSAFSTRPAYLQTVVIRLSDPVLSPLVSHHIPPPSFLDIIYSAFFFATCGVSKLTIILWAGS